MIRYPRIKDVPDMTLVARRERYLDGVTEAKSRRVILALLLRGQVFPASVLARQFRGALPTDETARGRNYKVA